MTPRVKEILSFEHGPARSFAPNPPAYDPHSHFELAIEAGCNAYAAPLGFIGLASKIAVGRPTGVEPIERRRTLMPIERSAFRKGPRTLAVDVGCTGLRASYLTVSCAAVTWIRWTSGVG